MDLFTLTNANGMQASITNYGAIITAIRVPGRDGKLTDVVQGFDSLADYTSLDYKGRYGATIGRFANRIKDNSYEINHVQYRMARDAYVLNEAENKPYDERVWDAAPRDGAEPQLVLSLLDRNGTMGFPGTLHVTVTYTLTRNNVLRIDYRAVSDKDTIISLTNHSYFNMAGDASGSGARPASDDECRSDHGGGRQECAHRGDAQCRRHRIRLPPAHADRRAYQRSRSRHPARPWL